ncbi:MAG: trimeric intracellular cation channel family protein [Clostridia bacterium]|nr:trimeric intracellular cation channel family protein [Clostridia bacterium]
MWEESWILLEIIGTIAFSVSGAFVGVKAKLDIFGVLFVGCVTSVGGGIMRDLLIGVTPPNIFSNLYILLVALVTATIVFIIAYAYRKKFDEVREKIEHVNNIFDAIGLATFSVMGTEIAFAEGLSANPVLSVLLGLLTGVGGGMIRDVLTSTTPYIFKKHVYALASIGGATIYYVLRLYVSGELLPTIVSMLFVVLIRMLATKYRWSLPKVRLDENGK